MNSYNYELIKLIRILLIVLMFVLSGNILFAQGTGKKPPKDTISTDTSLIDVMTLRSGFDPDNYITAPLSPNALELGKFGSVPVANLPVRYSKIF